jgi:hypothetical protein
LRLQVVQEPVSDWQRFQCRGPDGEARVANVLEKFYSDPRRYAYSFQHYVLMSRMEKVGGHPGHAVIQLRAATRCFQLSSCHFVSSMLRMGLSL